MKTDTTVKKLPGVLGVFTAFALLAALAVYRLTLPEVRASWFTNLFKWPTDFKVYYNAAVALNDGQELYSQPFVRGLPFTYPPFSGAIFKILPLVSFEVAASIWLALTAIVLLAVIIGVFRERGYAWSPGLVLVSLAALVASFNLAPIFGTFFWGQINIFLMGLVGLDFLRRRTGNKGGGIFSGLAAGIKLTPVFFYLPLLLGKRWRAMVYMTITILATVGIGFLFVPDAKVFWETKIFETQRIGGKDNPGAQSLGAVLHRLGYDSTALWLLCVIAIVALYSIAVLGCYRRGNYSMIMALGGVVACIISPFSWYHHWVFLVPLFVVFLDAGFQLVQSISNKLKGALGWIVEQLLGFALVALLTVVFLPFVSNSTSRRLGFFGQGMAHDNPIFKGSFTFMGVAFIVLAAAYYTVRFFTDRRTTGTERAAADSL
ncbi:glycosyltransferase family 87 protein [Corynebacterium macclintockiae]|uniref:glycosyltransferase family 87 protein n=1 Tax=Corynebacterium macclintockiae TaxID=2913501 RepID=UPI003EB8E066